MAGDRSARGWSSAAMDSRLWLLRSFLGRCYYVDTEGRLTELLRAPWKPAFDLLGHCYTQI